MKWCRHTARGCVETSFHGFSGCVAPRRCNPAAHGGGCTVERCTKCGATRTTNHTSAYAATESTGWQKGKAAP